MKMVQQKYNPNSNSPSGNNFFTKPGTQVNHGNTSAFFTKSPVVPETNNAESDKNKSVVTDSEPGSIVQFKTNFSIIQKQDDTTTTPTAPSAATTPAAPTATSIGSSPREQSTWNTTVDNLVRSTYAIRGPAARTRISYRNTATFAAAFSPQDKEEILLNIFFSNNDPLIIDILRDNHLLLSRSLDRMRTFLRNAISTGIIEYFLHVPGETAPSRISPDQLIAMFIGGFTTSDSTRSRRRITMQDIPPDVETLVHEVCHFYASNAFSDLANSAANVGRIEHGLRVQQILIEGFAEYFARRVMNLNSAVLGADTSQAYEPEYYEALRIISTMGETEAENAFFRGDAAALARMQRSMEENFQTHPDLFVPGFMIDD